MKPIAQFSIEYCQFLDAASQVVAPLPDFAKDKQTLIDLYHYMVLTRFFDKKAVTLQRTGKLGTYASPLGQEAVAVGVGHAMQRDDVLCPAYREYGAMLQRGVKMSEILLYWGGDERGSAFANNPHDLPICVPIATQCLHAAGIAKAFQLRQEPRVAVSVIGDGGTSQGDFYEAMNVAGVWHLPAVFIINNNQWAISVSRKQQTATQTLAQKGLAAEIFCQQVDGNDVIAVRHAVAQALERARLGKGASVIEAVTYRLCDHTTADDASRYQNKEEVTQAWQLEPIARLKNYLLAQQWWDEASEQQLLTNVEQQVVAAVDEYLATPPPAPEAMLDYLYANLPDQLAEQYADVVEFGRKGHA